MCRSLRVKKLLLSFYDFVYDIDLVLFLCCRHEDMEGFIREVDILTLGVSVWHVLEYDHYKMPDDSYGQFHEEDTYVVRWQYMIANAGQFHRNIRVGCLLSICKQNLKKINISVPFHKDIYRS